VQFFKLISRFGHLANLLNLHKALPFSLIINSISFSLNLNSSLGGLKLKTVILDGESLTIEDVVAVARENAKVETSDLIASLEKKAKTN